MAENRLSAALNDCVDRLAAGESLQACLARYPQFADELEIMLTAGQLPARARADMAEVAVAREAIRAQIDVALQDWPDNPNSSYGTIRWLSLLVALMGLGALTVAMFASRNNVEPDLMTLSPTAAATILMTATYTATQQTETPTVTATPSSTATRTPTPTSSMTPIAPTATLLCEQPPGWTTYRIQSGDTLSAIALNVGIELAELAAVNCIENPRIVVVGALIFVPREVQAAVPSVPVDDGTSPDGPAAPGDGGGTGNDDGASSPPSGSGDDPPDDNDDDDEGDDPPDDNDDDDEGGDPPDDNDDDEGDD